MLKRSIYIKATAIILIVIFSFIAPLYIQTKAVAPNIVVLLDNLPIHFDVPPQIVNGRTLVPFRLTAEALAISVNWDGKTRTITANDSQTRVVLQIDNNIALINDIPYPLDAPPIIINERTLIPLRFFSESFGCKVIWDGETRTIKIASPPRSMYVVGFYALGAGLASSWLDLFGVAFPEIGTGNTDIVHELALGWYTIDEQGNLLTSNPRNAWQRPPGWEIVLARAAEFGLRTEMVVHENNIESLLTSFLANEQAMLNAIDAIVRESATFHGVNLNLEGLGLYATGEDQTMIRDSFTHFVSMLSKPLREIGKTLTLTIHPPNSSFKGYDYAALGRLADRIIVMAHDYGPRPEPLYRVVNAVRMALADVPREKLVLAISVPSETPESILDKIGIAKRYRLQGISLWRLGLLSDAMWASLRQTIKTMR